MRIKSLIVPVVTLALAASAFAELEVISDNYYSMLKVQTQANATALAIPFVALEAAVEQHPISVAEAVDARTLAQGDLLMIYDHEKACFNEYEVVANSAWAVREVITLDRSGDVQATTGDVASQMTVEPGFGSWLMRSSTANEVILHGQLPYRASITVKDGKNLIGSVKLTSTDLNNCGVDWEKAGVKVTTSGRKNGVFTYDFGDSIVFTPTNSTTLATLYFVKSGDAAPRWRSIGLQKVDPVLPAGCACWLIHNGESFSYGMNQVE